MNAGNNFLSGDNKGNGQTKINVTKRKKECLSEQINCFCKIDRTFSI